MLSFSIIQKSLNIIFYANILISTPISRFINQGCGIAFNLESSDDLPMLLFSNEIIFLVNSKIQILNIIYTSRFSFFLNLLKSPLGHRFQYFLQLSAFVIFWHCLTPLLARHKDRVLFRELKKTQSRKTIALF